MAETKKLGFAAMKDPARQREIASTGGKSVPPEKRSYSQDRTLASEAGRRGGLATQVARKAEKARKARQEALDGGN